MIGVDAQLRRFGERLREVRVQKALNQADFAELGGVKKNSQVSYEGGKLAPTVEYLYRLADHDIDICYLVTGQRIDGGGGAADAVLLTAFNKLSQREREAIVSATTILAGQVAPVEDMARGQLVRPVVHSKVASYRGEHE
ncbi:MULTISPECIES: helix-turn-helix domain-containing protein [unclassified Sphingomonas]|uniref:helix-turn-helix domain-containing protein n=1 Tax=unclassified Sphingomonas TaxID=196159 RepID=UPI00082AA579|nr:MULTISPECIES: helix-turn-helix transcriptional regulator [unclassified Sphingomonas]